MKELVEKWDIGKIGKIEPIPSGGGKTSLITTLDNRCFVLKKKTNLIQSEREHALLLSLSKAGVPVAIPLMTVDGDWYALDKEEKAFCLYPKLPGQVITEHYDAGAVERARAFGQAIGLVHARLRERDNLDGFQEMELVEQVQGWAIPHIRAGERVVDTNAIERIWRDVEQEVVSLYAELPRQLIHRDPHPDNMLFDDGELTGFLDFEMVLRGPRIFDVCYCGSSMLVNGFQDSEKAQKWPVLFRSLMSGYEAFCPLVPSERLAAYGVLVAIELIFVAFCLDTHNEGAAKSNASMLCWLSRNRETLVI